MKILMPLDGSKFAEAVIATVAKLADETNAELHLIGVVSAENIHRARKRDALRVGGTHNYRDAWGGWQSRSDEVPGQHMAVETRDQALEREVQRTKDYLSNLTRKFQAKEVKSKVIIDEHVAEEIQSYAHRERIDVIALATHGRTGLANIIMGSVAMDLLKKGETPLLLVRPHDLNS